MNVYIVPGECVYSARGCSFAFINETTALKKNNEALDIYEKDDTGKQASIAYYGLHIKAVKKANEKLLLLTRQSKILG